MEELHFRVEIPNCTLEGGQLGIVYVCLAHV